MQPCPADTNQVACSTLRLRVSCFRKCSGQPRLYLYLLTMLITLEPDRRWGTLTMGSPQHLEEVAETSPPRPPKVISNDSV